MRKSPVIIVSVNGSPNITAEKSTPATGTPSRPSDVEIAGRFFITTTEAQKQKAVATGPLYARTALSAPVHLIDEKLVMSF